MTHITRVTGIVALGLTLLTAGPVIAQSQGAQSSQMPPAAQPTQDFSPQQLEKFADASDDIGDIQQSAIKEMRQAGSKQAQAQVRKQAQQDMRAAIQDAGLTITEYNQIARAARSNPRLAQKIQQMQ